MKTITYDNQNKKTEEIKCITHCWDSDKTCSTCKHYDSGKGVCMLDGKSTSSGGYCGQWWGY